MIKFSVAFISCLIIVSAYSAGKLEQEIPRFKEYLEELGEDLNEIEHLAEWEIFKEQYSKQYGDAENERRKKIFLENKQMIEKHNKDYKDGKVSFEMGLNEYSDLSHEEFKSQMNGLIFDPNMELESASFFNLNSSDVDVPNCINWVKKGYVTPVKNQGQCGSCWAFSATGAIEGQYFRKTGKLVSLSEQNLVDCSYSNFGCTGGWPLKAFEDVMIDGGIATEILYPYEGIEGSCRYSPEKRGATVNGFKSLPNGNENALKNALAKIGPISVAINAGLPSFRFYSKGIYNDRSCSKDINHAVLAVGYGTENGKDYYLVKNSWGTSWGDSGYIKMARNAGNLCGIASYCSYPIV